MRIAFGIFLVCAAVWGLSAIDFAAVTLWIVDKQRYFQNQMAQSIMGIQSGNSFAAIALYVAAGTYGLIHAAGPGHGKALIGAVGVGSGIQHRPLVGIAFISSLCQSIWAIAITYSALWLLTDIAPHISGLAATYLDPISYAAIAAIGLWLVYKGIRAILPTSHNAHCGCHHHHDTLPTLNTVRDRAVLCASIAIRPCSGAIFLLVIAWQMGIALHGAVAVLCMGLGTALFTAGVALASVSARNQAAQLNKRFGNFAILFPVVQIAVGTSIAAICIALIIKATQ